MPLLEVKNLKVHFPVRHGLFSPVRAWVKAVDDVSFAVQPGESLGLVGESGCGKSTLGRAIIKLVNPTAGSLLLEGDDLAKQRGRRLRKRRRDFQMIFQDPVGSLNPRMSVRQILEEPLSIHRLARGTEERKRRVAELLDQVGLSANQAERYPHEFSGGQRQRIGIARALAVQPKLIVCDEPVSALDVSVQAQIINLLADLQKALGVAYLFIAHDLAVVEHISQRIMVMYLGKVVEIGPASEVVRHPHHPYTQALISAVPALDRDTGRKRIVLGGEIPSPLAPPSGCPFHTRCPIAEDVCRSELPPLREITSGHWAACHLAPA